MYMCTNCDKVYSFWAIQSVSDPPICDKASITFPFRCRLMPYLLKANYNISDYITVDIK